MRPIAPGNVRPSFCRTRGFELKPRAYERYANALSSKGIDAYLLRYLTEADALVFESRATTRERREAYETGRFEPWANRVSAAVTTLLARSDSSGRLGLLGFSLGGYVAAFTAARDQRIAALAVLYGGMPDAIVSEVKHLPPLIELHGEAEQRAFRQGRRTGEAREIDWGGGRVGGLSGQTARIRLFGYRSDHDRRCRSRCQILRVPAQRRLDRTLLTCSARGSKACDPWLVP
jgi:dienelactone hydrolase